MSVSCDTPGPSTMYESSSPGRNRMPVVATVGSPALMVVTVQFVVRAV